MHRGALHTVKVGSMPFGFRSTKQHAAADLAAPPSIDIEGVTRLREFEIEYPTKQAHAPSPLSVSSAVGSGTGPVLGTCAFPRLRANRKSAVQVPRRELAA